MKAQFSFEEFYFVNFLSTLRVSGDLLKFNLFLSAKTVIKSPVELLSRPHKNRLNDQQFALPRSSLLKMKSSS